MPKIIQKEGQYRIAITHYELKESKEGAVGIHIKAIAEQIPGEKGWIDCEPQETTGDIWVIKKDGETNDRAVESLMTFAGWDGNLESIAGTMWTPKPCACIVKREEYKGDVRYKIAFLNSHDALPAMGMSRAKELQEKFGHKLHRLGGAVQPGAGSWQQPPPPSSPPAPSHDTDIPF